LCERGQDRSRRRGRRAGRGGRPDHLRCKCRRRGSTPANSNNRMDRRARHPGRPTPRPHMAGWRSKSATTPGRHQELIPDGDLRIIAHFRGWAPDVAFKSATGLVHPVAGTSPPETARWPGIGERGVHVRTPTRTYPTPPVLTCADALGLSCRRGDLNPHALIGHQALNLTRLPIPPLRRGCLGTPGEGDTLAPEPWPPNRAQ
jgi:hypothetical protein